MPAEKAEMHEALISRGQVQGKSDVDLRDFVFHPCNVVFRHSVCEPVELTVNDLVRRHSPYKIVDDQKTVFHMFKHGGGTGGDLAVSRCITYLIAYEGHDRVREYLTAMADVFPQVGPQALLRFDDLVAEIKRG